MYSLRWLALATLCTLFVACGGNGNQSLKFQCADGKDNDGDGLTDFPDDPGCTGPDDNSEDSLSAPACSDGRDNDGDGKIDYPDDPGCFTPQSDDETDDCPDGPTCPQCGNGKDDDSNGKTDFPDDPGCSSAADNSELTVDPLACGAGVTIKSLPFDNHVIANLSPSAPNVLHGQCLSSGDGGEDVYLLHLSEKKTVVATTDTGESTFDSVVYIRSAMCSDASMELGCNDNVSQFDQFSTVETALEPGVYFVVVDSKAGAMGTYGLQVGLYDSVGTPCDTSDTCAPGLVCRVPVGGTDKVCSNHVCNDGADSDGDGKNDYPDDPGCASPDDDDETDDCPSGPNCPACGDHRDNDGDGHIDYPADPSCKAASGTTEACTTTEGVTPLTMPMTMGDTTGATDDVSMLSCAFGSGAPDLTYQLHLPRLLSLSINVSDPTFVFFPAYALFGATCGPTELACSTFDTISKGALNAGDYYLVVDGAEGSGDAGNFQIAVSGVIAGGQSCESPLAQSGALTCAAGFICKGATGARTCAKTQCNDGVDNNGDGKIDYPNDPGCDGPSDDAETTVCPGANCPVCSNGMDDDSDATIDFPADFGCSSAAGTSEVFCAMETDAVTTITTAITTGTLATAHENLTLDCGFNSSGTNDKTYLLKLPVGVETLTIDTFNSTISDTVLELWNTQCAAPGIACDDDDPTTGSFLSSITATSVPAGNYAVTVKAYDSSQNGAFHLNTHGTVASGTACGSALFTANVLKCPTGTTCTGTPKKCQ